MKNVYLIMALVCMMMASCCKEGGDGRIQGHEYVDLGLPSGLKWATRNIGADNPEDYGRYFAWGETDTKHEYVEYNYQYWNDTDGDGDWDYGESTINSDISGEVLFDASTANWGDRWRMPTKAEQEELLNNCTWTWTTQNGVNGYKVTGSNGNSIFLPAAGFRAGTTLYLDGLYGNYWSSTPDAYDNYAFFLHFSDGDGFLAWGYWRSSGMPVRPVSE